MKVRIYYNDSHGPEEFDVANVVASGNWFTLIQHDGTLKIIHGDEIVMADVTEIPKASPLSIAQLAAK